MNESPCQRYGGQLNKAENSNFSTFASKDFLSKKREKCELNKNILSLKPIDPSLVKMHLDVSPSGSPSNNQQLKPNKNLLND